VSFKAEPDKKGPKAVDLNVIAEAPPAKVVTAVTEQALPRDGKIQLTVYLDPACPASDDVLSELHDAGYEPHIVDYMENPPSKEQLRNLAILLRGGNHSLVKKYDPLFLELRLDDRFISDSDFWDAIIEHPFLINGPVVATATGAGVCSSRNAVKAFISTALNGTQAPPKPKGLPERLLRLVAGDTIVPPTPSAAVISAPETVPESGVVETVQETLDVTPVENTLVKAEAKPKAAKPEAKAAPKAKVTPEAKAKKPAGTPARKRSRESSRA
jgi:arsenate reductase